MENEIYQKAKEAEAMVKAAAELQLPVPAPAEDVVALQAADPATSAEIEKRIGEIDMADTNSIVSFGSSAQVELQ